jgi:hypothetical protein
MVGLRRCKTFVDGNLSYTIRPVALHSRSGCAGAMIHCEIVLAAASQSST